MFDDSMMEMFPEVDDDDEHDTLDYLMADDLLQEEEQETDGDTESWDFGSYDQDGD